MEMADIPPSAPNTARLYLPEAKKSVLTIVDIQGHIIEDLLKMSREEIFCLQAFPNQGFYDASFVSQNAFRTFVARSAELSDHPDLAGFRVVVAQPRRNQQRTPVTVQLYNPFVPDEEIIAFLKRYCEYVSYGERRKNCLGTFNGLRRFWVQFKPDSDGIGGVSHPPQTFSIGPNRGFLFYPGQPAFCRDCFSFGHTREDCSTGLVCRNCFQTGHRTADCEHARKCHFCGSGEHLARQCPKVDRTPKRSYAGVVSGESVPVVPVETSTDPAPEEDVGEMDSVVAPDPLVAEGEGLPVTPEFSKGELEMEVEKASLKRKSKDLPDLPEVSPSEKIEEFPSSVEGEDFSDRDSDTSSLGQPFLESSSVKKLARTLNFAKTMDKVKGKEEWQSMQGVQDQSPPPPASSSRGRTAKKVLKKS